MLFQALGVLRRVGLDALVVGDRGLGRKGLVMLALSDGKVAGFRDQAIRLLEQQAFLGRRLSVGKLAEAIGLDFDKHRRAWAQAWLL